MPYPRRNIGYVLDFLVPSDSIHKNIKSSLLELAIQVQTSELLVTGQTQNIASEQVDVLSVSYFSGGSWSDVRTDKADAYLLPFLINEGNNNLMRRVLR